MTVYQWTTDDDEVAFDAITVGIGAPPRGFDPVELTASVYWPDWITQGDKVRGSMEGPYSIDDAFRRAESLRTIWAFKRVVIAIEERELWQPEWGELAEFEGFD